MAITLVTTVGGASANSYTSRAEALVFADELFPAAERDPFKGAGADDQNRFLLAARRAIDELAPWLEGERVDATQALEFPREGITKKDGVTAYLTTEIPEPVKRAQATLAAFLAKQAATGNSAFGPSKLAGLSAITLGSELSMEFDAGGSTIPVGERVMAQIVMPILGRELVRARQPHVVRG